MFFGDLSIGYERRDPLTVPIGMPTSREEIRDHRPVWTPGRDGCSLAPQFSLCAQTETPPYKYVSVEGPIVSTEAADIERDLRSLARRYLGKEMGDRYVEETRNLPTHNDNVLIRMPNDGRPPTTPRKNNVV